VRPLQALGKGQSPGEAKVNEIRALLDKLLHIESLWAFPGKRNFETLIKMFEAEEYQRFAYALKKLAPMILSQTYRHSHGGRVISKRLQRRLTQFSYVGCYKRARNAS